MDCSICCEKYNKSTRKPILCTYCDNTYCYQCTKRYLLESHEDPHCMNCRHQWNREYLDSIFPKVFMNKELKRHRENVLLEREKSLLPSTQGAVEQRKKIDVYKDLIEDLVK